ncbi:MAG: chemotaxis-specific protein-glutamate methyltransferase CheB [Leptolyngbya sp. SIO1D8]|nr:chemotaxis-specific protein-glutamate methyltransferase CheB [Leptolyngbya sp. SIO1D8]
MSIRVLLVEDSPVSLTLLKRILSSSPEIEVVGTAKTGLEALDLIPNIHPDVICTDFHMPQMNGLELTTQIMARYPRPILVISASVQEKEDHHRIFQLLEAGAVDTFPKPVAGLNANDALLQQMLINKVKVLSGVKVFQKKSSQTISKQSLRQPSKKLPELHCDPRIIAIGASTGGPLALQEIFSQLSNDFPLPIVCVQHISQGFLQGLIDWLAKDCQLPIHIAQAGERPQPGCIYFSSDHQHLEINHLGRFSYSRIPPVDNHCPSVTVLFNSVAQFYGRCAVGILLTGMGRDGAEGMKAIADSDGLTIAQDEATSVVFGMPKEAIDLGAAQHILSIKSIPLELLRFQKKEICRRFKKDDLL